MRVWAIAVSLLIVMLAVDVLSIYHKTITYDERDHYAYGERVWSCDCGKSGGSNMPFSVLNVIPWKIIKRTALGERVVGLAIRDKIVASRLRDKTEDGRETTFAILTGRLSTIFIGLLLGCYVFLWARALYGARGGLIALALYVLSPNMVAHSRLVTTDVYAATMIIVSTYYFWRFITIRGYKYAILSAFTLGLSQLAKVTCLFLVPIFASILVVRYMSGLKRTPGPTPRKYGIGRLGPRLLYILLSTIIVVLTVNAGFLFNRTFVPLGEYQFTSGFFRSLQTSRLLPAGLRVPFPAPYVEGLDAVRSAEFTGEMFGNIYLLGTTRETMPGFRPFTGYYFVVLLLKVPIAVHALVILSAVLYVRNRRRFSFFDNEVFLVCPLVFFMVYFGLFFRAQIGMRFFLVVLPFLQVFCGSLVAQSVPVGRWLKAAIAALMVYLVVSVASYFPHYISYFNEIVWQRKQAWKFLADSNIDWGQNEYYVRKYLLEHPDAILRPSSATSGTVIVSVNDLVGVFDPEKYKWIRNRYKPVGHIAMSYLIYEIPAETDY